MRTQKLLLAAALAVVPPMPAHAQGSCQVGVTADGTAFDTCGSVTCAYYDYVAVAVTVVGAGDVYGTASCADGTASCVASVATGARCAAVSGYIYETSGILTCTADVGTLAGVAPVAWTVTCAD